MAEKFTVSSFRKMKNENHKIIMLTAYDAISAQMAAQGGVEVILVGDSMANTALGYENTLPLTLDEAIYHARAVRRGAPDKFIIGDMPFLTTGVEEAESIRNAGRYLREGACNAIKLEGGKELSPLINRLVGCGIPVMAHIGLLPQHLLTAGGYRITGRKDEDVERLIEDAKSVEAAGAFALVLECMPQACAEKITAAINIPTIGIGAGSGCSGQVQVISDLLGLLGQNIPKHAKRYAEFHELGINAVKAYVDDVNSGVFPAESNTFN